MDGSGQFQEIRWSYQNLKGEPCSLPSGITELSIWLNQDSLPNGFLSLPVDSTSLTLPTPLVWGDVRSIYFNFRDDQGHNLSMGLFNGETIPLGIFLDDVHSQLVPQSEPGHYRRAVSIRRPHDLNSAWVRLIVSQQ